MYIFIHYGYVGTLEFQNEFHGSRQLDARDPALHAAIECVTNSAAALHAHAEFHPSSAF